MKVNKRSRDKIRKEINFIKVMICDSLTHLVEIELAQSRWLETISYHLKHYRIFQLQDWLKKINKYWSCKHRIFGKIESYISRNVLYRITNKIFFSSFNQNLSNSDISETRIDKWTVSCKTCTYNETFRLIVNFLQS